jgi:hypothetical protein
MALNYRIQIIKKSVTDSGYMERYVHFFMMELQRRFKLYQARKQRFINPHVELFGRNNFQSIPIFDKMETNMINAMICVVRLGKGFTELDDFYSENRYFGYDKTIQIQIAKTIISAIIYGYNNFNEVILDNYFKSLREALDEIEDSISMTDVIFSMAELQEVLDDYEYFIGAIPKRYYNGICDLLC